MERMIVLKKKKCGPIGPDHIKMDIFVKFFINTKIFKEKNKIY